MNSAKVFTLIWNLICALAAAGSELVADPQVMGWMPPRYAHIITGVALAAMWIRSHRNLFVNPDGTPAGVAYIAPEKKP